MVIRKIMVASLKISTENLGLKSLRNRLIAHSSQPFPLNRGIEGSSHSSSLFPLRQIFSSDFEERSDDHYYIIHRQSIFSQIFGRDFSEDSDKPHVR